MVTNTSAFTITLQKLFMPMDWYWLNLNSQQLRNSDYNPNIMDEAMAVQVVARIPEAERNIRYCRERASCCAIMQSIIQKRSLLH